MTDWYWVALPYATFGVGVRGGRVVETAGINHWMRGKDAGYCLAWARRKGGVVQRIYPGRVGGSGEQPHASPSPR